VVENSSERIEIKSIPKDWKVAKLGDIAEVKGGKRLPKGHSLLDTPTRFPYIRIVDFINMSVDVKNLKYLSLETHIQEVLI
jgi:type I restriction enzyme S subunit